jgi:hypothetical protein
MTIYTCDGCKSIKESRECADIRDAARIFANRLAKKEYGRTAYALTCNQNSYGRDAAMYQAFVGTKSGNGTCGSNITFMVSAKG